MREALKNAVHNAILLEYKLPHKVSGLDLDKSCLSSQNDICFSNSNPQEISKIIYNGIVEFAINEYEIDYTALEREQRKAILSRMRYDSAAPDATKLKYGFYGEVLLDLILRVFLRTSVLAARGYFYSPIENSEAKGFDAFHLMERNGNIDLWFGEAKFYQQYKSAMALPQPNTQQHKSFNNFAEDNRFTFLRYNQFEIVSKEYTTVKSKQRYNIDQIPVEIGSISKGQKIANIIKSLSTPKENTIIYCGRRSDTEAYAKALLKDQTLISFFQETCSGIESNTYEIFVNHLEHTFGDDWIVLKALKGRIGIHHSLIPKYIQKEIINLFNTGALLCLFSTTTITEGVNTSAKNIIITSNKKGLKPLRQFDAKNIAGRAGRFHQHYSGRVIDLNNGFENIVNGQPEILEHKNYDVQATKTDVDYQITKDQYLSESERQEKASILLQVAASEIPSEVFDCFRIVGPKDKLILYSYISRMPWWTIEEIKRVSQSLAQSGAHRLYWSGFQQIMDMILPIVREDKLKQLITIRTGKQQQYSLVTVLLSSYLSGGFLSMVEFYVKRPDSPKTKDEAMRQVADFVYNVFKYHLVKYLGLFDVFFRYQVSKSENINMEDVAGLGLLLQKLEYNALSPNARKVSDYGVPFKLIDCYDSKTPYDKGQFDEYEQHIDQEISRLFT